MLGSEKYKQFAADCIRIAEKLGCEDEEETVESRRYVDTAGLKVKGIKEIGRPS